MTTQARSALDAIAVQMHLQGKPMAQIMADTGLSRLQVLAAVNNDGKQPTAQVPGPRSEPVKPRPVPMPTPAPAAAPVPMPTETSPAAPVPMPAVTLASPTPTLSLAELLTWAASHDDRKIQTSALRVRDGIAELRARHAADAEITAADAEIERLTAALAAAKDRRRAASGKTSRPQAAPAAAAEEVTDRMIRDWAAETGTPAPAVGRIAQHIRDAYDRAHQGGEA